MRLRGGDNRKMLSGSAQGSLLACQQGKLQKHQAFEAEVQANSGAIVKLDETGNLMISEGHFASETIRVRVAPGGGGGLPLSGW